MSFVVRGFEERDVAGVAELHRQVFQVRRESSPGLLAAYARWLGEVLLGPGSGGPGMRSLVCEGAGGAIVGFMGVVPRAMAFGEERLVAAVSTQFVVSEEARAELAGVEMVRALLSGAQALTICDEANDSSRRLWEAIGGATALVPSLRFLRVLRPASVLGSLLVERGGEKKLRPSVGQLARAVDAMTGAGSADVAGGGARAAGARWSPR
ncbi:MAG: hypothetical protein R3F14_09130 [Polyangiaceae bacterium]